MLGQFDYFTYLYNMKKISTEEYLAICKVDKVEALTDKQVISYFMERHSMNTDYLSVKRALYGWYDYPPQKDKALPLLREAMKTGKKFVCYEVMGNDIVADDKPYTDGHLEMKLEDKS